MTLKTSVRHIFADKFGYQAEHTFQAPGRVNLIGEHTDYNDGFVLPCAINYQTVIACAKRDDRQIRVIAVDYDNQQDLFSLDEPILSHPDQMWSNYVRGVVKHLQKRNKHFGGVDMVITGDVPQGAGLSSSASLEVAIGTAIQQLYHLPLDGAQIALNGQEAENQFVGCNCGIMDQLISALGKKTMPCCWTAGRWVPARCPCRKTLPWLSSIPISGVVWWAVNTTPVVNSAKPALAFSASRHCAMSISISLTSLSISSILWWQNGCAMC